MFDVGNTLKNGRWKLEARLGAGGMAVVFRATHRNGQRAAIKVLKEEFIESPELCERFLREGYAANAVGHPGAVTILDDDVENGVPYLVMELLEGKPLADVARIYDGRMPLPDLLRIADGLLEILESAHKNGVIHRDIKPANIFLTTDGRVKLLDFGFAKVKLSAEEALTTVGALLGTPGFISPERLQDANSTVDARSDVWSVGATLYKVASGKPLFGRLQPHDRLKATVSRDPPSLGEAAPGLPASFIAAVDKALARDPAKRWQSAAEMRAALAEVDEIGEDEPTRVASSQARIEVLKGGDVAEMDPTQVGLPPGITPRGGVRALPSELDPSLPKKRKKKRPSSRGSAAAVPKISFEDEDAAASGPGTVVMANAPGRQEAPARLPTPAPMPSPIAMPPRPAQPMTSEVPPGADRRRMLTIAIVLLLVVAVAGAIVFAAAGSARSERRQTTSAPR